MPAPDATATLIQQLRALETVPDSYIVVSPELVILTASNAYLADTLKRREDLVGRYLFDAFTDNPATPEAHAVRNWRASLERVIATGQPHQMAPQHYDVLDPERPGHFVERHWLPRNTPVFDDQGQLSYLIHSSVNVTKEVQAQGRAQEARREAERQRQRLHQLVLQAPVAMCLLQGPEFVYELVNPTYQQLLAGRVLVGKPLLEAVPEFRGSTVWERLQQVYRTGQTFQDQEVPLPFGQPAGGSEARYFNHTFQARYTEHQQVDGVYVFAFDVTEQVHARQQLRHQQGLLRQIMHQVPAAIATLSGPAHRYSFFNDGYQALSGGRTQLGRPVAEILPEVVAQGFIGWLDQVYTTGQPFSGTDMPLHLFDARTGQPALRYVDFIYQPLRDEQQTQGILAFLVDVTDKVVARQQADALQAQVLAAAQQQASEREAFYQVFAQTPALVALLRAPNHRYEYVNPAYQAFFSGRPLVGLNAAQAVPELQAQGFVALMDRVYQTGETYFGQELPFAQLPGPGQSARTSYFDFTYQAYRESGEVVGISIFAFEVTKQVLARQQGEVARQRMERLFLEAPAAICILSGPELVYELVNPGYQALFPGRELLGKPILMALPEIADNAVYTTFRQVYETGHTHEEQALLIPLARPSDGVWEDRYFQYIQQPRYAVDGRIDGVLVFAFEVTEQVRIRQQVQTLNQELATANADLKQTNTQLTRTNVDLDTFVYTASHDLKAPITNIEGIVLALRDTLPADVRQDELVGHLLDLLNQTVARFQVTINQLTDISRLQLAHTGPAEPVVLATVVEDVRLDLMPAIIAAGTQLTVVVAPELVVSFSPANLRSIVYNLLSNALKYRDPARPSQVQLHAQQTPHAIQLTVQDNGLGMSEVQQRQLFGLFQRLHTHVEGTGVGLYITKRLVENAGGTITVASQPHVGTTFTVTFPV
ncbi:MAG: PAS domain-containing protein [Janthinobacterium lividum]